MARLDNAGFTMKSAHQSNASKIYFRLVESNAIVLLFLVMFSFVLFQHALIDYPRKDHNIYLAHKANFKNPVEWCQFSASYSRARTLQKGDKYLYRPAHMLFLCVEDVFLEKKPTALGAISVALAGITAFLLFLISSALLDSRTGGLLASLFWLTFYPGIELVLWRHISPYLFSLILGFGGIYYFYSDIKHKLITKNIMATAILLFASLFHEMVVAALSIFVGIKIFLFAIDRMQTKQEYKLNKVFYSVFPSLAAISLFALLNIIDFKINGHSVIGPHDTFLKDGVVSLIWQSAYATTHFIGLSILTLISPFNFTLVFMEDNLMLIGLPQNAFVIFLCALIGVLIISITAYYLYKLKNSFISPRPQLVAYSLCFLVSGFIALGILRGGLRGLGYLQWANYYFSIFTWCWIIILSFLLKLALDNSVSWQKGSRNLIMLLSGLVTAFYIGINSYLTIGLTITQYKPRAVQHWISKGLFNRHEYTQYLKLLTKGTQKAPRTDSEFQSQTPSSRGTD